MFIFVKFLISEKSYFTDIRGKRAYVGKNFGNPSNRLPGVLYLAIESEIAIFIFVYTK
jgi:hypothetical protein